MVSTVAPGSSRSGARGWSFLNIDTGEYLDGQFEGTGVTRSSGSSYAQIKSLGREVPILQFLSGEADEVDFTVRVFAQDTSDNRALNELETLRAWARIDPKVGRPPVLSFQMGDGLGNPSFAECVITTLHEDHVDRIQESGAFKGAEVQVHLVRYESFSVEGGLPTESRYHRVRQGEYFESLALDEYGDPLVGDIIRARNPALQVLSAGDVVKLPSRGALAKEPQGPRSTALATAFGKRDTPQRANFRAKLAARGGAFVSFVVK